MYFVFKQTHIYDAYNTIDESQPSKVVKAKTEEKARRKLPILCGRDWVLYDMKNRSQKNEGERNVLP